MLAMLARRYQAERRSGWKTQMTFVAFCSHTRKQNVAIFQVWRDNGSVLGLLYLNTRPPARSFSSLSRFRPLQAPTIAAEWAWRKSPSSSCCSRCASREHRPRRKEPKRGRKKGSRFTVPRKYGRSNTATPRLDSWQLHFKSSNFDRMKFHGGRLPKATSSQWTHKT